MRIFQFFTGTYRKSALFLLSLAAVIFLAAVPEADADTLKPGVYGKAGGWTLNLRADRYTGERPYGADYYSGGAITDDPWMYPVIMLEGPKGARYEYSLLAAPEGTLGAISGETGDVYPVTALCLEPDWDGDGLPEVYFEYVNPMRITLGYVPRGGGGSGSMLLRPGPQGWKKSVQLPEVSGGSEDYYYADYFCVDIDSKKMPLLRTWAFESGYDSSGSNRLTLYFQKMNWENDSYTAPGYRWSHTWIEKNGEADPGRPTLMLNDDQVNLRASADLSSAVYGQLAQWTKLEFLAFDDINPVVGSMRAPWIQVKVLSGPLTGKTGWVFGLFAEPYTR